ncbi:hypothetical protein HBB16_19590 [Pseudonocardia sp. MCCB 268]|nr:hypothetical protein [Pseudonocardia cytotoxica]
MKYLESAWSHIREAWLNWPRRALVPTFALFSVADGRRPGPPSGLALASYPVSGPHNASMALYGIKRPARRG